jgi:hypothetical protein
MKLGGNMKNIMKQMGKMKEQMERLQNETGEKTVEASSGGGMVTVIAKAKGEIISIVVEPEIISETDIEMLQDLVTAAVNEALYKGQELMKDEVSRFTAGMGLPPGLI